MTYECPKGHASEEADYCSECGIKMRQTTAAPSAAASGEPVCPRCAAPRVPGARFCEVCRYDFSTGTTATTVDPPRAPAPAPAPAPASAPPSIAAAAAVPAPVVAEAESPFYGKNAWAVVTAERALVCPDESASFPADEPPRSYPLDFSENLVGRRNAKVGVHPEVPINDPSVSSRHLKICRRPLGMVLVDVGSTNGTKVNGLTVEAGVEIPLAPGDTIDIGAWTRIVLEARS